MALQLLSVLLLLMITLCLGTLTEHQQGLEVANNIAENFMPDNNDEDIKISTRHAKEDTDAGKTEMDGEDTHHGKAGNGVLEQSETPHYFGSHRSPDYDTLVTVLVDLNKKFMDLNKKFRDLENELQDQVNKNKDLKDKVQRLEEKIEVLPYQQQIVETDSDPKPNSTRGNRVKKDTDWYHRYQASSGGVYTRWGRDNCPSTARKVYDGFVAGSYWNHTGGGSNYLCLPETPNYRYTTDAYDTWRARLYGVEYEIFNFSPLASLNENDAPCAVCQAMRRSNVLMVPARTDCPGGWTREYYGYLMSDHTGHRRTEFVCVDYNPKVRPGTAGENTGGNLCLTEGICKTSGGGLPCGPYETSKEITCSVCTK